MGKFSIIALLAFGIVASLSLLSRQGNLHEMTQNTSANQYETLARKAAQAGYTVARQRLVDGFQSDTFTYDLEGNTYDVTITVNGDRAQVTSAGRVNTGGTSATYTIKAEFERQTPTLAQSLLDYAVISEDDLTLNGNNGSAFVYDSSNAVVNANFHTNGDLAVNGPASKRVLGFGTYAGAPNGPHVDTKFTPRYNPDGLNPTYLVPRVELPPFSIETFVGNATIDQTSPDDVSLAGTYDLGGTRTDPYVWYIQGGLEARHDVTINGYAVFIVDGNIDFLRNVIAGPSGYDGPDESSLAFFSSGYLWLNGNVEIWGQFYCQDYAWISGSPNVYGSIATRSYYWAPGNPTLYYRRPSAALVNSVLRDVRLLSYNEQ